jgi:hypothetical protein
MIVRSSFRCSRSVSRLPSKNVTDTLIEVRVLLKSCIIASRKTDFKRSLSCVDRILLVSVRVFDPLLSNCGAEIKPAFILCSNFKFDLLLYCGMPHSPSDSSSASSKQEQIDFERRSGLFRQSILLWAPHDMQMRIGRSGPHDVCTGRLVRGRQSGSFRIKRPRDHPMRTDLDGHARRVVGI